MGGWDMVAPLKTGVTNQVSRVKRHVSGKMIRSDGVTQFVMLIMN
jgi:hypothetical protein